MTANAPSLTHANRHATGGPDAIAPADIGAIPMDGSTKIPVGQIPDLSGAYALLAEPIGAAAQGTANNALTVANAAIPQVGNPASGGNRVVALGDSTDLGAETPTSAQPSWPTFARLFSKGQINVIHNAGVTGNTTTQMLARWTADVVGYLPQAVVFGSARNDISNSVPLATYQANVATFVALCRGINAVPILRTITPTTSTDGQTTMTWNTWLVAYARRNKIVLLDFHSVLVDPSTGSYLSALDSGDHIHPNAAGYAALGKYVVGRLASVLPPATLPLCMSSTDTNNLLGSNALFTTTSLNGNGEPAGGWFQENPSGTTASVVTGDASIVGNWFRNTVAANAAEVALYHPGETLIVGHEYMVCGLAEASLSAGSWTVEVDVNGGAVYPAYQIDKSGNSATPMYFEITFTATQTAANIKFLLAAGSTGWMQFAQPTWVDLTALGLTGVI